MVSEIKLQDNACKNANYSVVFSLIIFSFAFGFAKTYNIRSHKTIANWKKADLNSKGFKFNI